MIREVNDPANLKTAFYRVFKSHDPFIPSGKEDMPIRVILFETDPYCLNERQFHALVNTLKDYGSQEFYISEVEAVTDPFDPNARWKRHHWESAEATFEEYRGLNLSIENALFSKNGVWGILLSKEVHGLLVCDQRFWNIFRKWYSDWKHDVDEFIEFWESYDKENNVSQTWVKRLLMHLRM